MKRLMLKRVFFIYNRVIVSQLLFLILTSIITTITGFYGVQEFFLVIWYVFIFIIPIITIILMYIKRYWLHYFRHWTIVLLPLSIIWLSPTFSLGILVDKISGIGKTFTLSIAIGLLYLIGYGLARFFRMDKIYSRF